MTTNPNRRGGDRSAWNRRRPEDGEVREYQRLAERRRQGEELSPTERGRLGLLVNLRGAPDPDETPPGGSNNPPPPTGDASKLGDALRRMQQRLDNDGEEG